MMAAFFIPLFMVMVMATYLNHALIEIKALKGEINDAKERVRKLEESE